MQALRPLVSALVISITAMGSNAVAEQDIAIAWEKQVRTWVQGIPRDKPPLLLLRLLEKVEHEEDLFALYQGADGGYLLAWARSREISAQAIFNMYKNEGRSAVPPVPIELRCLAIDKEAFNQLAKSGTGFLTTKPRSMEELASMGHAGSLFASRDGLSHAFEGVVARGVEPSVSRLFTLAERFKKQTKGTQGFRVYDFPQTKEMTQWRFNRALMNGEEGLAVYLLSIGANPDKDPRFFESPLEQSVVRNMRKLFEALIRHEANLAAPTSDGLTIEAFSRKSKASWALKILSDAEKH